MTHALFLAESGGSDGIMADRRWRCPAVDRLCIAILITFKKCYIVVGPDKAIVKTGIGGLDVTTAGGTFDRSADPSLRVHGPDAEEF